MLSLVLKPVPPRVTLVPSGPSAGLTTIVGTDAAVTVNVALAESP
jgi:hypothetical protein